MMNRREENPIRQQSARELPGAATRMRFFKAVAGPGMTAYPSLSDEPTVYYGRILKDVSYTETVGAQSLSYTQTDNYDYFFNLATEDYIEENSVVLCFELNRQWYTIDKVKGEFLLYSTRYGTDGDGDRTVRLKSCNLSIKKSGHAQSLCVDIDDDKNEYHISTIANAGIAYKRNSEGSEIWSYTGETNWEIQWLAVDASGNVYGVDDGLAGDTSCAVFKLNSSGVESWRNTYPSGLLGGITSLTAVSVSVDSSGNSLSCAFGGGHVGLTNASAVILYHDTDGNFDWYFDFADLLDHGDDPGDISLSSAGNPAFDSSGNVYVGFSYTARANGDGSFPTFDTLYKFDSSGNLLWSKELGASVTSLCVDRDGNLFVTYSTRSGGGTSYSYLTKFSGGDPNAQAWTVQIESWVSSGGGVESNVIAMACDSRIPACVYTSVYLGTGPDPEDRNKLERYSGADGSIQEIFALPAITEGLVASPGRHPNFF